MPDSQDRVYKIASRDAWDEARRTGSFLGSDDDRRDGFIHLSAGSQLEGTLIKHFKNQRDLVLVAIDAAALGNALKWERSRGGDLFPHLYGPLKVAHALWQRPLALDLDGVPVVEADWLGC